MTAIYVVPSKVLTLDDVARADLFASAAHAAVGQKRKYTGEDYIVHPREVHDIVCTVTHSIAMRMAALLHDVLEDTKVTYGLLHETFGLEVADMVLWLTDVSKPEDGNRSTRKAIDRQHLSAAPGDVQTIKAADLIANTRSILAYDKGFAVTYLDEKRQLLDVMVRADPILVTRARAQITVEVV